MSPALATAIAEQKAKREALKLLSDEELLVAHHAGEERAAGEIQERYRDRLVKFAARILGDRDAAEDIVQEGFMRFFKRDSTFSGQKGKFSTWAYTIVKNLARNELRDRKRKKRSSYSLDAGLEMGYQYSSRTRRPDEELELNEALDKAAIEILLLPEGQKHALLLRGIQGLDYDSVAEALGVKLGTAKSRIGRAREAVTERMRAHLN